VGQERPVTFTWPGLLSKVLRVKLDRAGACMPELETGFTGKGEEDA